MKIYGQGICLIIEQGTYLITEKDSSYKMVYTVHRASPDVGPGEGPCTMLYEFKCISSSVDPLDILMLQIKVSSHLFNLATRMGGL